jgi:hypothetical protein
MHLLWDALSIAAIVVGALLVRGLIVGVDRL